MPGNTPNTPRDPGTTGSPRLKIKLKDGRSRRILPEWVDEYAARRATEAESSAA